MPRQAFRTELAPRPAGPYSQSVRIDNIVVGAGQAGIRPDGSIVDGVREQTRQAFANLLAAMAEAGATGQDVVSVRVFLRHPEQFAEMNEAYAEVFTEPYPARTTVFVGLPAGLEVEVDALAVLPRTDPSETGSGS
ncbi:MAG TPA: RidA family protein [Actinomycetes bacterium]|nr:RidA family protein [Actinomycetes bacterium]